MMKTIIIDVERTTLPRIEKSNGQSAWIMASVDEAIDKLSIRTGLPKSRITNYLLQKALAAVEVVGER